MGVSQLKDTAKRGNPLRSLWSAGEANAVKKFVRDLRVQIWNMPYTEVDAENAVIYIPQGGGGTGGGSAFNGTAYKPNGVLVEDLTDALKPWLRFDRSSNEITEQEGPPPEPWAAHHAWRKKNDIAGAWYVPY